jgi:hypothetical protein
MHDIDKLTPTGRRLKPMLNFRNKETAPSVATVAKLAYEREIKTVHKF